MFPRFAARAAMLVTAAATLAGAQAPAFAESVEVRHGDLDVASAAGQKELRARVRRAAVRICSEAGNPSLEARMRMANCRRQVVASTASQVEQAMARGNAGSQLASVAPDSPAAP